MNSTVKEPIYNSSSSNETNWNLAKSPSLSPLPLSKSSLRSSHYRIGKNQRKVKVHEYEGFHMEGFGCKNEEWGNMFEDILIDGLDYDGFKGAVSNCFGKHLDDIHIIARVSIMSSEDFDGLNDADHLMVYWNG
eukprot:TRINITY_DN2894_c0_g1_i1.p2 TRINITY_DN2894_c0_g1~~TRINITY_DN2894_c0_g1_i1.p2  ORF type:complete len:134 (-),score=27.79 TRINITY_DN2894_c0_g1_i1:73-474(-)